MSWTATISQKQYNSGSIRVDVNFANGANNFTQVYNQISSYEDLQSRVQSKLKELAFLDAEVAKIPDSGALTLPTDVDVTPTDEELALKKLYELKEMISLGVIKETDTEYVDAVAAYKATLGGKAIEVGKIV